MDNRRKSDNKDCQQQIIMQIHFHNASYHSMCVCVCLLFHMEYGDHF